MPRRRRRGELETALAGGVEPSTSPELLSLARELERPETRQALAACIRNLIDAAEEPTRTWRVYGIDPPLRVYAVLAARDALIELATELRAIERPAPRGVALAARLVHDPSSPIYIEHANEDVATLARAARDAMSISAG